MAYPGLRVHDGHANPAVVDKILDLDDALDGASGQVEGRVDEGEQTHGLVIGQAVLEDGLCRQPGTQVAEVAGHDAEASGDVVVNLAAAAVMLVVHCREVKLHVDPQPDHQHTK